MSSKIASERVHRLLTYREALKSAQRMDNAKTAWAIVYAAMLALDDVVPSDNEGVQDTMYVLAKYTNSIEDTASPESLKDIYTTLHEYLGVLAMELLALAVVQQEGTDDE